jgi:dihydrodipicolinate synthase/N-acetylneuraminate lyase
MTQTTESKKQKYERFKELFAIARQRYLDAGGDPLRSSGSLHDNHYLTDEERQELFALGSELSGDRIIDGYIHSQGRSWKLPDDSPLLNQDEVKSEA